MPRAALHLLHGVAQDVPHRARGQLLDVVQHPLRRRLPHDPRRRPAPAGPGTAPGCCSRSGRPPGRPARPLELLGGAFQHRHPGGPGQVGRLVRRPLLHPFVRPGSGWPRGPGGRVGRFSVPTAAVVPPAAVVVPLAAVVVPPVAVVLAVPVALVVLVVFGMASMPSQVPLSFRTSIRLGSDPTVGSETWKPGPARALPQPTLSSVRPPCPPMPTSSPSGMVWWVCSTLARR